jgi:uncharacterized membrane protein YqiK
VVVDDDEEAVAVVVEFEAELEVVAEAELSSAEAEAELSPALAEAERLPRSADAPRSPTLMSTSWANTRQRPRRKKASKASFMCAGWELGVVRWRMNYRVLKRSLK